MSVPRPYEITVYNRANEEQIATYVANDPPRSGDLLALFPADTKEGDPFHLWGMWRVDAVVWQVSSGGSANALELGRETNGRIREAVCWHLSVLVWPEQGPFWTETPKWAKALESAAYRDDADEDDDHPDTTQENKT